MSALSLRGALVSGLLADERRDSVSDGTVSIVVVNGGSAQQISFFVAGTAWPASVTPYVTTTSSKLAAGTPISVSGGRFSASLAGQSVTTFVGKP